MTTARYPQVTDELLSAYIDDAVTEAERRLVVSAAAEDAEIAWRLESLRTTVRLLRELPALALPRSFVLTPEQLAQTTATALSGPTPAPVDLRTGVTPPAASSTGLGTQLAARWRTFWQAGNPVLRNAMAASFAALVVLLAAPRLLAPTALPMTATTANIAALPSAPGIELAQAPTRALSAREADPTAPAPEAAPPAQAAEPAALPVMSAPAAGEAAAIGEEEAATQPAGASGADTARQAAPTPVTVDSLTPPPADGAATAVHPGTTSGLTLSSGPRDVLAEAAAIAPPAAAPPSLASAALGAEEDSGAALAVPEAAAMSDGGDTAPMLAPEEPVLDTAATPAASTPAVEPAVASTEAAMAAPAAAAMPATPTAAIAAANERAREMNPPAPPATAVPLTLAMFIPLAQWVAAVAGAAFGMLWWRSRRR